MPRPSPISLSDLITSVDADAVTPLDQVAAAAESAAEVATIGDEMLDHFVAKARDAGHTWAQIGERLRISRQAAQSRFRRPNETADQVAGGRGRSPCAEDLRNLSSGPFGRVGDVPTTTGGPAGVFTIWIDDELVALAHSRLSADEAKPSNKNQADGARGRLVGVRRQPSARIQRAIEKAFPDYWDAADGSAPQKRASSVLKSHGRYRMVTKDSGVQAADLMEVATVWLPENGWRPLVSETSAVN